MSPSGSRIFQRRKALGLSQEALAEMIGTSQKQISRYETGVNTPTADVLAAMSRALDTTADYLIGLTDIPDRPLRGQADLTDDEKELVTMYRSKPPDKRQQTLQVVKVL